MEKTCFVISPIGEEGSPTRRRSDQIFKNVIKPAVEKYHYIALRADSIARPGIITTQIIEQLIKSELVIVDLTDKNPNVFYELGIRHMVRKHVIQIIDPSEIIPFEIANLRTIKVDYKYIDSMEHCKNEIIKQLGEIEKNQDHVESPVTFAINLTSTEGGNVDKQEKINVQLVSEMQNLKADLDAMKRLVNQSDPSSKDWRPYPSAREWEEGYAQEEMRSQFRDLFKNSSNGNEVKEEDLISLLEETPIFQQVDIKAFIRKMMLDAVIYEPRRGYYRLA